MSILIKGMDMPKTAFECSTKINPDERRCNYTGKVFEENLSLITERICKDCPLAQIPAFHGRLISSSSLLGRFTEIMRRSGKEQFSYEVIAEIIVSEHTIIEAEEV